ncbi:MAG: flavodoxin-dependent (E)-4-hydroxy-3-methylbut-2-enyl-diphosphate synthase [Clostridiales bacterium]|nr:flavodoxin-dependent (E)-4-hydroxy-3-methylbut-2-enyl-diphosphate synthase [Clostridiales bacterium]
MTKKVFCGNVQIGGGAPVSIQSMLNVDVRNFDGAKAQLDALTDAGAQIVRIAVPDMESAEGFGKIKKVSRVPLVADIHFDYRLAIAAIENGADKVRINPGNIGSRERVEAVIKAAKERRIPVRIGVNSGSLEKEILAKYGGVTAEGLCESALKNIKLVEDMDFSDIVVSLKSSDIRMNTEAHRLIAKATDYPLHIGLTEAGTPETGKRKSAIALGALLLDGIGDTMRVSLTGDPVREVVFAKQLLQDIGLRDGGIKFVSCPTCGRTKVNLPEIAEKVEKALAIVGEERENAGKRSITVAVMGCAVNGPGEAREADLGAACGDGKAVIFAHGEIIKTVKESELADTLIALAKDID